MKCPVCNDVDLTMSERQGVEIDYCSRCRGVWLDRGELDKIIERSDRDDTDDDRRRIGSGGGSDDRDRDRHRDDRRPYGGGDYGGKPYKKKSFWHELFD
jgi:Zn-finger nucleic acid-binding protein